MTYRARAFDIRAGYPGIIPLIGTALSVTQIITLIRYILNMELMKVFSLILKDFSWKQLITFFIFWVYNERIFHFRNLLHFGFWKFFQPWIFPGSPNLQNRKNAYFYKIEKMLEKAKCKKCLGEQNRIFAWEYKIEKMLICKI